MVHSQILGKTWLVHRMTEKMISDLYSPRFPAGDAEHPLTPPPHYSSCVSIYLPWVDQKAIWSTRPAECGPRSPTKVSLHWWSQSNNTSKAPTSSLSSTVQGTKFVIVPNTIKNKHCSSNSPMSMTRCLALWRLWTNEDSQWMNSPLTCRENSCPVGEGGGAHLIVDALQKAQALPKYLLTKCLNSNDNEGVLKN